MAIVKKDTFDKAEDKAQQSNAFTTGVGGLTGSQSSAPSGGSTSPSTPKGSSQAPNIQKYIQANIGAGKKIAGDIQGKGQTSADKVGESVRSAQDIYQKRAANLGQSISAADTAGQQVFQQAGSSPVGEESVTQAKQLLGGQLGNIAGQLSASDIGTSGRIQAIQNLAGQVGTEGGRFQALSDIYKQGGRQYGTGKQRLDQLLLQKEGGQDLQRNLTDLAQGAQSQVKDLESDVATSRAGLVSDADSRRKALLNLIQTGSSAEGLEESLQQRGTQDISADVQARLASTQQRESELDDIINVLDSGGQSQLTSAQAQQLGLAGGQRLFGENLRDYIGTGQTVGIGDVASNPEIERYRALQNLVGGVDQFGSSIAGIDTSAERSAYDPSSRLNTQGLSDTLRQKGQQYSDLEGQIKARLKPEYDKIKSVYDSLANKDSDYARNVLRPIMDRYEGISSDTVGSFLEDYEKRLSANTVDLVPYGAHDAQSIKDTYAKLLGDIGGYRKGVGDLKLGDTLQVSDRPGGGRYQGK